MKRKMSWLLISLAALLAFPAAASAAPQPFDVTFEEARLQLNNGVVDETNPPSETTNFDGTIDDVTGDITVPQAGVDFAQFQTSTGAPVIVQPQEPFTGNLDGDTGDFTLGGNTDVFVPTSQTGGCRFNDVELNLDTAGEAPSGDFEGTPFINGIEGVPGSAVTSFDDLPPVETVGTGDPATCSLLASLADGPGALQVGNDISLVPISFSWDANRLQLNNGVFDDVAEDSSNFEGTYDTDSQELNIPQGQVDLAQFTSTQGAPVTATATEDYTGTFDPESGDLTLGGLTRVTIVTGQTSACVFDPTELAFSTDNEAPTGDFEGAPFEDGLEGATGAAVATLDELPPVNTVGTPPVSCDSVRAANNGPSAISIGNEIVEPAPVTPSLNPRVVPKNSKVRQGGSRVFRVYVRSQDATEPTTARVCAQVPGGRRGLKLTTKRCQNVDNVYTEVSKKRAVFKVRAKRGTAPKKFRLKFTATAQGYDSGSVTANLKVQKKKKRRG